MSLPGDPQYVEQKVVTWLAAGFIKGVGVQLLLCAAETLVWILIGSPTGTCCIDCCVFFLWLSLSGCLCVAVCSLFVCLFVCVCAHLHSYRGLLQALMMFAEWKASSEALPNHMLIKIPTLQWLYPLNLWSPPLVLLSLTTYITWHVNTESSHWYGPHPQWNQLYFCLVLIWNVIQMLIKC